MGFCGKCGSQIDDGAAFCPSCGSSTDQQAPNSYQQPYGQAQAPSISNDKAMGVLAYIGILVLVPIFAAKDSKFARYHANQGLVLILLGIAYAIVEAILIAIFTAISFRLAWTMTTILGLLWLGYGALAVIGIINVCNNKMKPLPLIGGITLLK